MGASILHWLRHFTPSIFSVLHFVKISLGIWITLLILKKQSGSEETNDTLPKSSAFESISDDNSGKWFSIIYFLKTLNSSLFEIVTPSYLVSP